MKITLVLTGFYAGKTVMLNRHQFVNGECTLEGQAAQLEFAVRYLERCYGAKQKDQIGGIQYQHTPPEGPRNPEGISGRVNGPAREVHAEGDLRSVGLGLSKPAEGDAGMGASGGGQPDTGLHPDKVRKIAKAVAGLDPKTDAHWTEDGVPAVEVISAAISDQNLTRKMIEVAAPGVTRETVADATDL